VALAAARDRVAQVELVAVEPELVAEQGQAAASELAVVRDRGERAELVAVAAGPALLAEVQAAAE
jgi:hypothetical protein